VDIRSFFDDLDHSHLRSFLDRRVRDGVIRRVLHKWLKAGVLEQGTVHYPDTGIPQGGVISPLLANVYLHEVLDVWFEGEVKPRLQGRGVLVRYADDFVLVFQQERDARRLLEVLPKRFGASGYACTRTRRGWCGSGSPRPARAGDDWTDPGREASTSWVSPTTGGRPGKGARWSSRRRRGAGSPGR